MSRFVFVALLGVAACTAGGGDQLYGPSAMQGWRAASGKPPTRAEFAAVVAACQDGMAAPASAKPLDSCLADLGLRRAP